MNAEEARNNVATYMRAQEKELDTRKKQMLVAILDIISNKSCNGYSIITYVIDDKMKTFSKKHKKLAIDFLEHNLNGLGFTVKCQLSINKDNVLVIEW